VPLISIGNFQNKWRRKPRNWLTQVHEAQVIVGDDAEGSCLMLCFAELEYIEAGFLS